MITIDYGTHASAAEGLRALLAEEFGLTPEGSEVVREAHSRVAAAGPEVCGFAVAPETGGEPTIQVWFERGADLQAARQEWGSRPDAQFFLFKREQGAQEGDRQGSISGYHRSDFFHELGWHLNQTVQ